MIMRKLWILAAVCAVAGCSSAPETGQAPSAFRALNPVPPLGDMVQAVVSVVNAEPEVALDGALILELKLVNVSRTNAIVYNELEPGWLVVIEMLGENGQYVRSQPSETERTGRGGKYHYACLPPGGFVGTRYRVAPQDPRWNLGAGKYSVRVVYRNTFEICVGSPLFTDSDIETLREKALVPLATGLVVSNIERFSVVGD